MNKQDHAHPPIAPPQLPIGYWLKQADNLLTEQINKIQAANGTSRFEWQVLNLLKELGSANKEQLFENLRTFVDASNFNEIISHLVGCGWLEQSEASQSGVGEFHLSEEGRRQYEVIFAKQKEVRERAMQGISVDEYATVVRVLQQMVSNLGEHR